MRTLDKRRRILVAGIVTAAGLSAVLAVLPSLLRGKKDAAGLTAIEIPEADLPDREEGKTDSYTRGGIADYWDSLEEVQEPAADPVDDTRDKPTITEPPPRRQSPVDVDDLFGDCRESKKTTVPLPAATPPPVSPAERDTATSESPGEGAVHPPVKRSGAVSSLDEDVATALGSGFSTLDGKDRWVESRAGKPYRCMFTRDGKVGSGQRVTVRLLEDLVVDGVHIPRNTHLQGVANLAERLEVEITSIEISGRIIPLRFEAYDTDGGRGIYCPEGGKARKAVTEQGLSTASSLLDSRLGRIARDAASAGAGIIRGKGGEATVSIPAGYTFYIIEKTD